MECGLVDAYSLPLADDFLEAIGAGAGAKLLVVEDNYAGGIGSAVAVAAARRGGIRVETMTPVRMPKSGRSADDVMKYCGIDAACDREPSQKDARQGMIGSPEARGISDRPKGRSPCP